VCETLFAGNYIIYYKFWIHTSYKLYRTLYKIILIIILFSDYAIHIPYLTVKNCYVLNCLIIEQNDLCKLRYAERVHQEVLDKLLITLSNLMRINSIIQHSTVLLENVTQEEQTKYFLECSFLPAHRRPENRSVFNSSATTCILPLQRKCADTKEEIMFTQYH